VTADFVVLVTAKAPVPGKVKTRLVPPLSPQQAALVAAASLVDTLDASFRAVDGDRRRVVLSIDGPLEVEVWPTLSAHAAGCTVIQQVGDTLGERLQHAHGSTGRLFPGTPVVQVGMDTPQVTPDELRSAAACLHHGADAVLGPATDGGWWLLGLRSAGNASVLAGIPMSTAETGDLTRTALLDRGLTVHQIASTTDIDTYEDAALVRGLCTSGQFAETFDRLHRDGGFPGAQ
jgi:rSAM/selenodomain-associated transferase 1